MNQNRLQQVGLVESAGVATPGRAQRLRAHDPRRSNSSLVRRPSMSGNRGSAETGNGEGQDEEADEVVLHGIFSLAGNFRFRWYRMSRRVA